MQKVKSYRLALNLSQTQLAKAVGVTKSCVSGWEKGEFKPSLSSIVKLASVLHCSIDDLLSE